MDKKNDRPKGVDPAMRLTQERNDCLKRNAFGGAISGDSQVPLLFVLCLIAAGAMWVKTLPRKRLSQPDRHSPARSRFPATRSFLLL